MRIIEHDFAVAVKMDPCLKFIKLHRKARFVFLSLPGRISFQSNAHVRIYLVPFAQRAFHVGLRLFFQRSQISGRNLNFELQHFRLREQLVLAWRICFRRCLGLSAQPEAGRDVQSHN